MDQIAELGEQLSAIENEVIGALVRRGFAVKSAGSDWDEMTPGYFERRSNVGDIPSLVEALAEAVRQQYGELGGLLSLKPLTCELGRDASGPYVKLLLSVRARGIE